MTNLKLLCIITDLKEEKKVNNILNLYNINNKYICLGSGVATESMLEYFGLSQSEKSIIMALVPDYLDDTLGNKFYKDLKLNLLGKGLGFIISVTSANKYLVDSYKNKVKEVEKVANDEKYELIVTIALEGYIEKIMNAVKKAGGEGGTAIMGKGLGGKSSQKLFGFVVEPGRDIVLNVVPKDKKKDIMEAITKEVGIKTDGMGICFSLPIDKVIGYESE